jgi:uncharacterized protein (DUF2384 family)
MSLTLNKKATVDHLVLLRKENKKTYLAQVKSIDDLAIRYLTIPEYKESILIKALLVKNGTSGDFVKFLSGIISCDLLSKLLNISKSNLALYYKKKSLNKYQTESILGFTKIWSELMTLFKNRSDVVNKWLTKEKATLCGYAPINLMDTEAGRQSVLNIIYQVKTGDLS